MKKFGFLEIAIVIILALFIIFVNTLNTTGEVIGQNEETPNTEIRCKGQLQSNYQEFLPLKVPNKTQGLFDLRFIQMTDSHIITGGIADPSTTDGRTDQCATSSFYIGAFNGEGDFSVYPNYYSIYCSNSSINGSIAPTIAMRDAVSLANQIENVNFTVFTGDLVANELYDTNKINSLNLFKEIADNLSMPYYVLTAYYHDLRYNLSVNPNNKMLYEERFGPLTYSFIRGNNLFIVLSETENKAITGSYYDLSFLQNTLETYKNQNMNVFVFLHTLPTLQIFRAEQNNGLINIIESYKDNYNIRIVIGGHNHANDYVYHNNTHFISTTALMNYPTEFRIVDIYKDYIHIYMSNITSPEINNVSETILDYEDRESSARHNVDKQVYYGTESDRDIYISLCLDNDGDGITDCYDNCPNISNSGQEDHDNDAIGDVCEPCYDMDFNKDYKINFKDIGFFSKAYGSCSGSYRWNSQSDFNKDGCVNWQDVTFFSTCYGKGY